MERSYSVKVRVEELDGFLGPEDQLKKGVMDAVEDYVESCAQVTVDVDVVERLLRPEKP